MCVGFSLLGALCRVTDSCLRTWYQVCLRPWYEVVQDLVVRVFATTQLCRPTPTLHQKKYIHSVPRKYGGVQEKVAAVKSNNHLSFNEVGNLGRSCPAKAGPGGSEGRGN
jgi:hypothetical protein